MGAGVPAVKICSRSVKIFSLHKIFFTDKSDRMGTAHRPLTAMDKISGNWQNNLGAELCSETYFGGLYENKTSFCPKIILPKNHSAQNLPFAFLAALREKNKIQRGPPDLNLKDVLEENHRMRIERSSLECWSLLPPCRKEACFLKYELPQRSELRSPRRKQASALQGASRIQCASNTRIRRPGGRMGVVHFLSGAWSPSLMPRLLRRHLFKQRSRSKRTAFGFAIHFLQNSS